jgi:hypothetical protein
MRRRDPHPQRTGTDPEPDRRRKGRRLAVDPRRHRRLGVDLDLAL